MSARDAAARARAFGRRYRVLRVAAALWRFAQGHSPRWLRRLLAVCLLIPGCLDEIIAGAVLAALVVWALRAAEARRELAGSVRKAWGG